MSKILFGPICGFVVGLSLSAQGAPQPISTQVSGAFASGIASRPFASPDGRWLLFTSTAGNLVAGDSNGTADVFLLDRTTGAIELISRNSLGTIGNDHSWGMGVSDDGQRVVFNSFASNLVGGDNNNTVDGFLRDRTTGTTVRVTISSTGAQLPMSTDSMYLSGDGSTVVFSTQSGNVVPGDTNGQYDVFARDLTTGTVTRISNGLGGAQSNDGSFGPVCSADGRFVCFHALASNLVAGDSNGLRDVFVHDRLLGATTIVSNGLAGVPGNGASRDSSCSADGRRIAFTSVADNLVANDTNAALDIFVHDRQTGSTRRVSVDNNGAEGTATANVSTNTPVVSADGRWVAFYSGLDGLAGPSNTQVDAFVHDLVGGRTLLLSQSALGVAGNGPSGLRPDYGTLSSIERIAIASNPPLAVFATSASNLVPIDNNGLGDVFAVDAGLITTPTGPAAIGGQAEFKLDAEPYPNTLFAFTFSPSANTGLYLPARRWLPLDFDPLLFATLGLVVTDAQGIAYPSLPIPLLPGLVGQTIATTALRLDFTDPALFAGIADVVSYVIQ